MRKLLAVLVVTVMFSTISWGATYYVDAVYGRDTNLGTSSSSPWKTIAKVNATTFRAGDIILFKKGATWKETLTVKQSGTSSALITFDAYGTGSLPVIDGGLSRSYGIYVSGKSYVQVRNFRIQNTTHGAIYITASKYITVKYCDTYITGRAGVFIQTSSYSLVSNNKMTTPATYYNVQTDGIYAQRNSNNTYASNNIVISNEHADQHCDAIQTYEETSAIIKNNYVEQRNAKTSHAQGIYCSTNHGTFKIFNNVGYGMNTKSSLLKFKNYSTYGKSEVIGNTLYGGKGALFQTNDPYIIFKNNILVTSGSYPVISYDLAVTSKSNINYNIYKRNGSGTSLITHAGTNYTINTWKSAGFDGYGMETDPKFASISSKNFTLLSTSPALNKGLNLSSPYNVDMLGTARPYGSQADIGAYEMKILSKTNEGQPQENTQITTVESFELAQNFPNPFNPATTIRYSLPENSEVSLKVYDITGSEVAELVNNVQTAGTHEISFDATNLASGTYIYILRAKDFMETKKMILLK